MAALRFSIAILALAIGTIGLAQSDQPGVSKGRILFGQSAALTGPAASLGLSMRDGIEAAFHEVNEAGGIHGRELALISYDDAYEPQQAIANTERLLEDDHVFALIGAVGTPTSAAAAPIATAASVPFIGPFTGANFLRDPELETVVNVRASYEQEAEEWIDYLAGDRGFRRIAILYQDDSFGNAGLAGVKRALALRDMSLVAEGTYKRNTTAVKRALLEIRKHDPEAVVIVGAYQPAASFIETARSIDFDPVFIAISFVGSQALAETLGDNRAGVMVTQVVPPPTDTKIPLVNRFREALARTDPEAKPGFISLEGYLVARLVISVLEELGDTPTREGFLELIKERQHFDLDGITLTFGPDDNQGMDRVFLTVIRPDGSFDVVPRDRS
ncbi:MAG: ABC transporter substrate-binding protein [Pseudomonadota bacterium]